MKNHKSNCSCIVCINIRKEPHKDGCMCIGCQSKRGALHKEGCVCNACKLKNGLPHKDNCGCASCKTKRKELHTANCMCPVCISLRGEKHTKECTCCTCRAYKREYVGVNNPNYGKPHTKKWNDKIGNGNRGKKRTEKTIENLRLSHLGKKFPHMFAQKGKKQSPESIHKRLMAICARPNKFELRALAYLNLIYNNKFKYTGNGILIINHRSADAYSKELSIIALFNGVYWHLEKRGYETTEDNKRIVEKYEAQPFIDAGYKVIFIWEDELTNLIKNSFELKEKINNEIERIIKTKQIQYKFKF